MILLADTSTPVFATGVLFGALLLFSGLSIGIWLGRRGLHTDDPTMDNYHLGKLLRGLFHWTDGFATDVSKYRELMDCVKEQMNSVESQQAGTAPAPVVTLLQQIVQANDLLQSRLDTAERTLQDQATEIASYLSEARTDTLTGLPNRRVFDDELARRMAEFRRNGSPLSVMIVDIDYFKKFNDRFGHLAGDAVLAQVARVLHDTMRESDLVARLGGEEFAILLPGTDAPEACQAMERARIAIEKSELLYDGNRMHVTISCGAAQARTNEESTSLVNRADQAMYSSKSAGRNFAHWHDAVECVPITRRDYIPTAQGNAAAAQCTPVSREDFRQVCDDLRDRVRQLIQEQP